MTLCDHQRANRYPRPVICHGDTCDVCGHVAELPPHLAVLSAEELERIRAMAEITAIEADLDAGLISTQKAKAQVRVILGLLGVVE